MIVRGLLLILAMLALSLGYLGLGGEAWQLVPTDALGRDILYDIRLPRLLLALINGAVLGGAGAIFQIIFRNPLAEPGITGVSSGTALAIVIALYWGQGSPVAWTLPMIGMLGGVLSLGALWLLAGRDLQHIRLILAGVAIAALCGAGISLVLNLAPNPFAFQEWSLWLMGSVANRGWEHVLLLAPIAIVGMLLVITQQRFVAAHVFDELTFSNLGFRIKPRMLVLLGALTLWVSGSVVSAGAISFLGLLAPHLTRLLGVHQPQRLIWFSMLVGAVLLVLVDALVLWVPTRIELQLGVVTALLGAPLLLQLLRRQRAAHA